MMGPVSFCLTSRKVPGWVHIPHPAPWPSLRPIPLPKRRWEQGICARGILETEAGQRLYSKGTVKVNSESRVHGLQEAEEHSRGVTPMGLLQHGRPACPLSPRGATGTVLLSTPRLAFVKPGQASWRTSTVHRAGSHCVRARTHIHSVRRRKKEAGGKLDSSP